MAKAYTAAMPPDTPLVFGGTVEFVAIDPTTGNAVSGVTISNSSIWYDGPDEAFTLVTGPFMLVPGPGA